jgi:hypothetical protein
MIRSLVMSLVVVTLGGCQCGQPDLIRVSEDVFDVDAGPSTPDAGKGVIVAHPAPDAGGVFQGTSWCASDCDCPPDKRCLATNGELSTNLCVTGISTCTQGCAGGCLSGQQCNNGVCEQQPCVGTSCTTTFQTSVQGTYATYYELDIHDFANSAGHALKLLTLLDGFLNGQGVSCAGQSTAEDQLMCFVVNLIGQNIHAPPWVGQLISVMTDAFRFGNKPVRIKGVMQLAEGQSAKLYASETISEMWVDYNGQSLNVMAAPQLGANGQITVTVPAFKGTRTATEVSLGPRSIEFDVNKLIVNMLNVVITAASQNQAHDVGGLLDLILCSHLSVTNKLLCENAAKEFAKNFTLDSGLGGAHLTVQKATIYDLDGNSIADALGLPAGRGSVTGEMSNGLVSGSLGSFPASNWYGTK